MPAGSMISLPSSRQPMTLDTLCIELTSRCPMRCVHCSACASPARSEMANVGMFVDWLDAQPELREIYLSGGEPFEYAELETIAKVAVARANKVIIYSSGATSHDGPLRPLDEAKLERLAGSGISRIDISVYSLCADLHDGITATAGSLDVALESCRRVRRANLGLGIHFVPLPGVDECLVEVLELCRALEANRLHVLAPTRQGRGVRLSTLLSERFCTELVRLMSTATDIEWVVSSAIRRRLGSFQRTERDGWRAAFIDVYGFMHLSEGARMRSRRDVLPLIDSTNTLTSK